MVRAVARVGGRNNITYVNQPLGCPAYSYESTLPQKAHQEQDFVYEAKLSGCYFSSSLA
jgi:hypothetical protein